MSCSCSKEDKEIIDAIRETGSDRIQLRSNRARTFLRVLFFFVAGVAAFVAMWAIVSAVYNEYFMYALKFPTPLMVWDKLVSLFAEGSTISSIPITEHIQASLFRWIIGFIIGFTVGLTLGVILSMNDKLYDFGMVPVSIWQMIPSLAWMPVTILIFGFGDQSAIFIISATVIAPIAINVANGLRRVPPVYRKLALMGEKDRFVRLFSIMIPYASLDIVAGLRIGMANGWRTLISAEMVVGVARGLGFSISMATEHSSYTTAFACIVIICTVGVIIDRIILANVEKIVRKKSGMGEDCCCQ